MSAVGSGQAPYAPLSLAVADTPENINEDVVEIDSEHVRRKFRIYAVALSALLIILTVSTYTNASADEWNLNRAERIAVAGSVYGSFTAIIATSASTLRTPSISKITRYACRTLGILTAISGAFAIDAIHNSGKSYKESNLVAIPFVLIGAFLTCLPEIYKTIQRKLCSNC